MGTGVMGQKMACGRTDRGDGVDGPENGARALMGGPWGRGSWVR